MPKISGAGWITSPLSNSSFCSTSAAWPRLSSSWSRRTSFLGLDPEYRPAILDRPVNKTMEAKIALDADVKSRLQDLFAPDVAELVKLVPTLDLTLWKGMNET